MNDKRSCPVCEGDLEFESDTYCGGTCADIAEMRTHEDKRIKELERELAFLRVRLERELDRAIPILEERNVMRQEIRALRVENEKLRDAVTRIGEELKYKHDPEFQGALNAWRGLPEAERESVHTWIAGAVGAAPEAIRLLKAAAR